MTQYRITIDLPAEASPGNCSHMEAMIANRNNKIKVLEVVKL